MRVLITGVGDAFTRTRFGCSGVVQTTAGFVLIDCPDLIHRTLHEASRRAGAGWKLDVSMIDDVILTHLHGDHCNGVESFGFFRRILRLRDPSAIRPRLHVTQPVADRLWQRLAPAMETPIGDNRISRLEDYFDVRILTPGTTAEVSGLSVECRFTKHPIPTIGLLLCERDRERDRPGGGLGWSGDTPFERAHVDWLDQAGVIVHESNVGPSHTPIESLNALPAEIKRKMRLTHLPDDFAAKTTDITILREGDVLEV